MRKIVVAVAMALATHVAAAGTPPKGCYEKTWSKAELKKLPLQMVTAIRLEANLSAMPDNKPQAYGNLMARFRDSGSTWMTTPFECSDTGAGYACATHCDGSIFVLSPGSGGLQIMPPQAVGLFNGDCGETSQTLKMNADRLPFLLARRGSRACPAK